MGRNGVFDHRGNGPVIPLPSAKTHCIADRRVRIGRSWADEITSQLIEWMGGGGGKLSSCTTVPQTEHALCVVRGAFGISWSNLGYYNRLIPWYTSSAMTLGHRQQQSLYLHCNELGGMAGSFPL